MYDQQSSDENNYQEGGADIQQNQPIGQSFIPSLSFVGFIRLFIYNGLGGNTTAATIHVNLHANSITRPILSTTAPVFIPGGTLFTEPVNFFFASPVAVTPSTSYYFQPIIEDNNNLGLSQSSSYNYLGGTVFAGGVSIPSNDLWFREGVYVVPEPSSALLVLVSGGALAWSRRRKIFK